MVSGPQTDAEIENRVRGRRCVRLGWGRRKDTTMSMNRTHASTGIWSVCFALVCAVGFGSTAIAADSASYRVTLENLTAGQPLSPPVAATHKNNVVLFEIGRPVSVSLRITSPVT